MYQSSCSRSTSTTRDDAMMATMRLISSTPEAYHTYHFYRGDVGAMLPPKICYNQSINIFIANSKLSIIKYYTLNFPQGSYKFYVGSPTGSHLSKLVVTPVDSKLFATGIVIMRLIDMCWKMILI